MTPSPWTPYQLWYGRDEPPGEKRELRAGPVSVVLDGRDVRAVRFGDCQIVDRVYVALRDRNWGTVPGVVANLAIDAGEDRFAVTFDVVHRQGDLDVAWRGEIVGTSEGVISYTMDAVAGDDATYKLVGLNSHHGMREYAGRSYHGETPEGPIAGAFPLLVGPQLVEDLTEVPIFPAVSTLTAHLGDGVEVRFDFEGDLFEWEDQRNWTDASFKAQSFPPRRNGFYHTRKGEHVRQRMTITPLGTPPPPRPRADRVRFVVGESEGRLLPPIGFGMASHGGPLSAREVDLLQALRPDHLRVDLRLAGEGWEAELTRAVEAIRALGCGLELALFLGDEASNQLARLAERLAHERPSVARVLVFHEREAATSQRWLTRARGYLQDLAPGALFVGGTVANFCELNRFRPERAPDEGVVYSINPQIHAFDEASLVENLAAQSETVRAARAFSGDRPIVVGPVTLKPRFNAVATEAEAEPAPDELPAPVDLRQMSLFAAGWTVGSVNYLAESGAASLTYYEATGWRGVIETDAGSPPVFPSQPGIVFPLYHVFADLADWRGGELIPSHSDDPLAVDGLVIRAGGGLHLLLANLTPRSQQVAVASLGAERVTLRRLNETSASTAMTDPAGFRAATEQDDVANGEMRMSLAPFEMVRVDGEA